MAEKKSAAPREITRSATVTTSGLTIDDIVAAAGEVGAPNSATVATGTAPYNPNPNPDGTNNYPYSVTYTWTEEI